MPRRRVRGEHHGIADKIKDRNDNYLQLSDLIDRALIEPALKLTRNAKTELPKLRNLGHRSAHGRYFTAQKNDLDKVEDGVRVVVEELENCSDAAGGDPVQQTRSKCPVPLLGGA